MFFNEDLTIEQRDFIDRLDDELLDILNDEFQEECHRESLELD